MENPFLVDVYFCQKEDKKLPDTFWRRYYKYLQK